MNGRTNEEARTLYEGRALRQQRLAVRAQAVARAVQDVLDGTCDSADEAARGRGLSGSVVQAAVRKARADSEARVRRAAEEESRR